MSQQITIIVMVDIPAALESRSLEGNVYLIDNLRAEGSEGVGTGDLVTAVEGSHWRDGSQAGDIVLNWMVAGIGSLPPTLPRTYWVERSKAIDDALLQRIKICYQDPGQEERVGLPKLEDMIENVGTTDLVRNEFGDDVNLGLKALNVYGEPFKPGTDENELNFMLPYVSEISGEAVDQEVIFPAQYGCPVPIKDGWYWSATVDTSKTGIYGYTMEITLYERVPNGQGAYVWYPVPMSCSARIKVTNEPRVNGFTGAGMAFLPIV